MWLDKLKEITKLKKIKLDEMAEISGMSRTGFRQGYAAGSLRFDVMIKILKHYIINYYELIEEENMNESNSFDLNENSNKRDKDINKLIEKLKESYEDRIKKCDEYNETLKSQIMFLQQVLSKNIGLGEVTSHTGLYIVLKKKIKKMGKYTNLKYKKLYDYGRMKHIRTEKPIIA